MGDLNEIGKRKIKLYAVKQFHLILITQMLTNSNILRDLGKLKERFYYYKAIPKS